jgi:2-polyprenyl-6-methoxyphenol hydroxylase-like FAD-dependent oxidoreductase
LAAALGKTEMPNVADVIVVGFGPVGAVLAALLGRAGIQRS